MSKKNRNRPDMDGSHRAQYDRNKKIIFHTQEYCALCGGRVDFDRKFPDPMSPSIDHIIPVALGGHPSALDNMQLTHLGCNSSKGNRIKPKVEPRTPSSNRALPLSADWTAY